MFLLFIAIATKIALIKVDLKEKFGRKGFLVEINRLYPICYASSGHLFIA